MVKKIVIVAVCLAAAVIIMTMNIGIANKVVGIAACVFAGIVTASGHTVSDEEKKDGQ